MERADGLHGGADTVSVSIQGVTRGGNHWIPMFLQEIDATRCIGCGRCYKVCGREVMELAEYEGEDEAMSMAMTIVNPENCIGCQACSRVCPKKCHSHAPFPDAC